jgi:hypothetical protein
MFIVRFTAFQITITRVHGTSGSSLNSLILFATPSTLARFRDAQNPL